MSTDRSSPAVWRYRAQNMLPDSHPSNNAKFANIYSGFFLGITLTFIAFFLGLIRFNQQLTDANPFPYRLTANGTTISSPPSPSSSSTPSPSLFCWITATHLSAQFVLSTWAPKCDRFALFSIYAQEVANQSAVLMPDKRLNSRRNFIFAITHLSKGEYKIHAFDWILLAHDHSFVIVENLRYFLAILEPDHFLAIPADAEGSNENWEERPMLISGRAFSQMAKQLGQKSRGNIVVGGCGREGERGREFNLVECMKGLDGKLDVEMRCQTI